MVDDDDLPDIDIDNILDDMDTGSEFNPDSMSKGELFEYVHRRGSVELDNQGRMLISCPCSGAGLLTAGEEHSICGIYPLPDPNGGGMKQVCTGPLITKDVHPDGKYSFTDGGSPSVDCPYDPHRLEHG